MKPSSQLQSFDVI